MYADVQSHFRHSGGQKGIIFGAHSFSDFIRIARVLSTLEVLNRCYQRSKTVNRCGGHSLFPKIDGYWE